MTRETTDPKLLYAAYKAAGQTNESSLATLSQFWMSNQVKEPIDSRGYTILHFLAYYDNSVAIKRLHQEKLLTIEQLIGMCDVRGDTPLHVAARFGRLEAVKAILDRDQEYLDLLLSKKNNSEDTPVYVAAASGETEVFYFLMDKIPRELVIGNNRTDGSTVLHVAIGGQFFVLAYSILEAYPELADRPNKKGFTPLYLLACNNSSFKSGSKYHIKNISSSPFIPGRIFTFLLYYLGFATIYDRRKNKSIGSRILAGYWKFVKVIPFLNEAWEERERHLYARAVAVKLVNATQIWPLNKPNGDSSSCQDPRKNYDPFIEAIRNSIKELVKLILKRFPEAVTGVDEKNRNILHVAAEIKDTFMYEYLKSNVEDKKKLLSELDSDGNTALHLAAAHREAPKTAYGPLYSMAWDVFWYKHIKMDIPAHLIRHRNSKNLTAKEIFKKSHISQSEAQEISKPKGAQENTGNTVIRDDTLKVIAEALENGMKAKETPLIKDAEEEAKRVNEGLMIVSVLISTINFAAVFTIPGGFSQEIGIPLFFLSKGTPKSEQLKFFLLYIGVSLLTSLIALGAQLSIHLSRFRKIDFYFILPMKIFIATTALYYSTTFAITACFQAYILEEDLGRQVFAGMAVACIPASLVYFDLVYYIMNYLYFPIWYKFLAPTRKAINPLLYRKTRE